MKFKVVRKYMLQFLFIGISAKVIEHITDDAYNRQGGFRGKLPPKRGEKAKHDQTKGEVEVGTIFFVY